MSGSLRDWDVVGASGPRADGCSPIIGTLLDDNKAWGIYWRTYDAMKENFQAKLKEHEEAIAAQVKRGEELNAELNDIGRDIARRQGAVTQLQVLLSELHLAGEPSE
jgi:uncharacterized coiled-coil protein SlyX